MRRYWKLLATVGVVGVIALAVSVFTASDAREWADPANAEAVALGERLYGENCAECHGGNLEGEPNWRVRKADGTLPAPPHDRTGHTWHHGDELLFSYTEKGGAALGGPGFKSAMPAFGDVLSDRDIWAVLAFIKSRWPEAIRNRQQALTQQR